MRKLFLPTLVTALGMFSVVYASPEHQIAIPSQSELEHYIWEIPTAVNVDLARTTGLIQELQSEVGTFLDEGRRAPWMLGVGRAGTIIYFRESSETMYYLALAYPYLSPTRQAQIRSFVSDELTLYNPLWGLYDWSDGLTYSNGIVQADPARRREAGVPGPYNYCGVTGSCEEGWGSHASQIMRNSFDRLYDIWFYAHRTGDWSAVETYWNNIVNSRGVIADIHDDEDLLGMPLDANESGSMDSANRRVAALIAYTRMAHYMGDADEVAWGVDAATRAMQARLRYTNNNRPTPWDGTASTPDQTTWESNSFSNEGIFIVRRGGHSTNIPEYREMRPEVGWLLTDYAAAEFSQYDKFVDTVKPVAYMQIGSNSFGGSYGGEVPNTFPHNIQGIFLARALVTRLPGDELRKYADVAWVKQDYFYWERLARLIDAYGTMCLEDLYTPATECPTGIPSAIKTASTRVPQTGVTFTYTITLVGGGVPITVTDAIPMGTEYAPGSVSGGWFNADLNQVEYTGVLDVSQMHSIVFGVEMVETRTIAIINTATVIISSTMRLYPSAIVFANGQSVFLPITLKRY